MSQTFDGKRPLRQRPIHPPIPDRSTCEAKCSMAQSQKHTGPPRSLFSLPQKGRVWLCRAGWEPYVEEKKIQMTHTVFAISGNLQADSRLQLFFYGLARLFSKVQGNHDKHTLAVAREGVGMKWQQSIVPRVCVMGKWIITNGEVPEATRAFASRHSA